MAEQEYGNLENEHRQETATKPLELQNAKDDHGDSAHSRHEGFEDPAADYPIASGMDGEDGNKKSSAAWLITGTVVFLTFLVTSLAISRAVTHPRTDDAEVFANYIGMAPQVDGPIVELPVRDNQYVKAGDLLFAIDARPYQYALERALSQQASLEGQIVDRRRSIASQVSAVGVATANIHGSNSNREASVANVHESDANVENARESVLRAEADRQYAADNLHRLEPLLAEQFVTVDQVDQARTLVETRTRAVREARAEVAMMEARVSSDQSHFHQSEAEVEEREAQQQQAAHAVQTIEPLTNQRGEETAAVRQAQYNLNNCRVYAPFDGYITNMSTSLGAYVHTGNQVFTMIDAREWWVVANFRETQLAHVVPGSSADLFLMARDRTPLHGVVESIGYGVTPDPSVASSLAPGFPDVQRTLSWVHLAARYPVRIRVQSPPPRQLRIGQSAVAVIHIAGGL